jgi:excisionase family DNA binding protein
MSSPYLTAEEAAAYLRFRSVRVLYHAIETDGIPVRRCGRRLLFHRDEIDRWLAGESRLRLLNEARSKRAG